MAHGRAANAPGIEKDAEALVSSSSDQTQATAFFSTTAASPGNALSSNTVASFLTLPAEITSAIGETLLLERKYGTLSNLALSQKQVRQYLCHLVNNTKVWTVLRKAQGGQGAEKKRWMAFMKSDGVQHLR